MRILFAADMPPNPDSGAAGTEYQTVQALRALGHEVDCIWADQLPHRIRHWNLHFLLELPFALRERLRQYCRRQRYDAVHLNQPHCWLAAKDYRLRGHAGVVVQRSHGWELRADEVLDGWRRRWQQPEKPFPAILPTLLLRRLLARHNRLATRWCDGTIVYCTLCRDYIVRRHRVAPERVAVIAAASTDEALQQPLPPHIDETRLRILYVSQFAYFKGPALVAEAMQQLAQRFPQAHFTWVCDTLHHPEVRARLGTAAERCRLLGWMSQQQLRDVYDDHGVFLFPSLYEGFGKVFLEAMSRGLCVVGSDEGGMRDVLRHGDNGMIVPVGNSTALVEAAAQMMSDPALFRRVGEAARRTALAYTWHRAAQETVAFYEQLAEFKRREPATWPAFGSR